MLSEYGILFTLLSCIVAEDIIEYTSNISDKERHNITDKEMAINNEVVNDNEKFNFKKKMSLLDTIKPLPAEDIKCLLSMDIYCSNDMKEMKGVLIEAIQRNCENCSTEQKQKAGRIIASMLVHDAVSWKMLLTRYGGAYIMERL